MLGTKTGAWTSSTAACPGLVPIFQHRYPGPVSKKLQIPGFSKTQVMHFHFQSAIFAHIPFPQNCKQ